MVRAQAEELESTGRVWLRDVLGADDLAILDSVFSETTKVGQRLAPSSAIWEALGKKGAIANALNHIMPDAFPTRVVSFNKTATQNWGVPWHQDRVIAAAAKCDHPDFDNWSQKGGIWHCEPPISVLDKMLFLRIHLDDDIDGNGAMEIAKGSHVHGRVPASKAEDIAAKYETEICRGKRGDVLVLKMLTLHRSSPAAVAGTRRVLRVDYANRTLPEPVRWNEQAA